MSGCDDVDDVIMVVAWLINVPAMSLGLKMMDGGPWSVVQKKREGYPQNYKLARGDQRR